MQSTQQKVREAVKEQQDTVRNILQLAPVPLEEPDCRYTTALLHILLARHLHVRLQPGQASSLQSGWTQFCSDCLA